MNKIIVPLITAGLVLSVGSFVQAGSAQWNFNPNSGDWNSAANWMQMTIPNGPADIATFGFTNTAKVSISADTQVEKIMFIPPSGIFAYTITASPGFTLTLSGEGIINKVFLEFFVTAVDATGKSGRIFFTNSASAGKFTIFSNNGATVQDTLGGRTFFFGNSTAANGEFRNNGGTVKNAAGGETNFFGSSTAGSGTFINNGSVAGGFGGETTFGDGTTAGKGTFINNDGLFSGRTLFFGDSSAASGTFTNNGGAEAGPFGGETLFSGTSTAASGTFTNNGSAVAGAGGGFTSFGGSSTAGNGTFTSNGGTAAGASGGGTWFVSATADSGTFINNGGAAADATGGYTVFLFGATAANGKFTNNGGMVSSAGGGRMFFSNNSNAGSGTFTNNGGAVALADSGHIFFRDNSNAGSGTFTNNGGMATGAGGGEMTFLNTSTAGSGTFTNNGGMVSGAGGSSMFFIGNSTAANGRFTNNGGMVSGAGGGSMFFIDNSTAASGTFINNAAAVADAFAGFMQFSGSSTAGSGTFINNGGAAAGASGAETAFFGTSTAGSGTFTNNGGTASGAFGGFTKFSSTSTADSATLIANGGSSGGQSGMVLFEDDSTGGTSRIEVFGNGSLDVSVHNAPGVTIGSMEGDGKIFLGANNLIVGTNNRGTSFSGVIQDGGQKGGVGGSLTKVSSGTLDLTGVNTYSGNTNINGGVLKINGSIASYTFVNTDGTLAGTGTIQNNLTNTGGTVSPGDPLGKLTVTGSYTQQASGTLAINIASENQFSLLNILGSAELDGTLNPILLNGFTPLAGDSFTFLEYASFSGSLTIQNPNINGFTEHWFVTYLPDHAILGVAKGTVAAPDEAATLLLLALSLSSLVIYQRSSCRKQA